MVGVSFLTVTESQLFLELRVSYHKYCRAGQYNRERVTHFVTDSCAVPILLETFPETTGTLGTIPTIRAYLRLINTRCAWAGGTRITRIFARIISFMLFTVLLSNMYFF